MKRMVGMLILAIAGGCASGKLSESQEYYVGRAMAAQSVSECRGIYSDEHLHEYLAKVGWTVALASDRPDTFLGYNFLVLDSDEVGAWAAPSGFVFVTTACLKAMQNEDQLAAVLAHEIAHVNLKHPEEVAHDGAKKAGVMDLLAAGGAILAALKPEAAEDIGKLVEGLTGCVGDLMDRANSGYSREYELAADRGAVDFLTRSEVRYNPFALADFLALLPQKSGKSASGPYATHPGIQERIDAARQAAQEKGIKASIDPARTQRFRAALGRLGS